MRPFWLGFESKRNTPPRRRYVVVFCWDEQNKEVLTLANKARIMHPTIKIKAVKSDTRAPAIILLGEGREVNRLEGREAKSPTLVTSFLKGE
jgi:hypothetical protein